MESQVSPKGIEDRVKQMDEAAAAKPADAPIVEAPKVEAPIVESPKEEAPKVEAPKVEAPKVEAPKVEAPKVEAPKVEKKQPNDAAELRKWATKAAQEAAEANRKVEALTKAIEKLSKKPVDYAALGKDPDALRKHIDAERAEAAADLQKELTAAKTEVVKNETIVARMEFERDTENYPRWAKVFPLIQTLTGNQDGRINFNRPPREVLHDLYVLADQLSPVEAAAPAPVVPAPVVPTEKVHTQAEVDAIVSKAREDARKEAEASLRAEANGAGLGSAGRGGRRDNKVSKDALQKMPLSDLKKLIAQGE